MRVVQKDAHRTKKMRFVKKLSSVAVRGRDVRGTLPQQSRSIDGALAMYKREIYSQRNNNL
jgi:hypothetical protein